MRDLTPFFHELTRMLCVFPCNAYSLGLNRGGTTPGKVVFGAVNLIFIVICKLGYRFLPGISYSSKKLHLVVINGFPADCRLIFNKLPSFPLQFNQAAQREAITKPIVERCSKKPLHDKKLFYRD